MLRVHSEAAALTIVSRLARPPVLAVLVVAGAAVATAIGRQSPPAGGLVAAAIAAALLLGGRGWRARLAQGRLTVRPASPLDRVASRPLGEFVAAQLETIGEARARRAEEQERAWAARTGGSTLPSWLRRPAAPGVNDHLRRVVLVGRGGERVPLTAWLPPEDDLEAARSAVEARLG